MLQDLLLLRLDGEAAAPRGAQCWRALDGGLVYCYRPATDAPPGAGWQRLACVQSIAGASHGQAAGYHYVVETDVLPDREADLNAWYAQEHLPGLAAVPGTVRATRYVDLQGSPRYYACYDLVAPQALESAAWLAVRATDWSSRVRPAFRNTRRTMFRIAPAGGADPTGA